MTYREIEVWRTAEVSKVHRQYMAGALKQAAYHAALDEIDRREAKLKAALGESRFPLALAA